MVKIDCRLVLYPSSTIYALLVYEIQYYYYDNHFIYIYHNCLSFTRTTTRDHAIARVTVLYIFLFSCIVFRRVSGATSVSFKVNETTIKAYKTTGSTQATIDALLVAAGYPAINASSAPIGQVTHGFKPRPKKNTLLDPHTQKPVRPGMQSNPGTTVRVGKQVFVL